MADVRAQVSTSLAALTREFDIIAHNMANVSTTGFKRRCNSFTQVLDAQTAEEGGEASAPEVFDFSQGGLIQTDRTLDFALYGKGFFVIETPDGPLYTRHGVFHTDETGQIVDTAGRLLAGTAGPVVIPPNIDISEVHVSDDGRISGQGVAIGQLRIVDFAGNENRLVPAGLNCFQAPEDVKPEETQRCVVRQGYQEASNVSLIDELVGMITVCRLYDANTKLLAVQKDATSSMIGVAMG